MKDENDKIIERIKTHPGLHKRFEAILDIADNKSGELVTADQTEGKAIEEIEKLGRELLREWALKRQDKAIEKAKETHPNAKTMKKKALLADPAWKNRNRRNDNENRR